MRFVADTQALIRHVARLGRLGKAARRAFRAVDRGRSTCLVSTITFVEIALLHERGRLEITPAQVFDKIAGHTAYSVVPLDLEQSLDFNSLPAIRDPMDRMIVAAARVTESRLITSDEALHGHGVEVVWD